MGQLVEWPEVITEGKTIEICREMLRDALNEMILAYREQGQEIPLNRTSWNRCRWRSGNVGQAERWCVILNNMDFICCVKGQITQSIRITRRLFLLNGIAHSIGLQRMSFVNKRDSNLNFRLRSWESSNDTNTTNVALAGMKSLDLSFRANEKSLLVDTGERVAQPRQKIFASLEMTIARYDSPSCLISGADMIFERAFCCCLPADFHRSRMCKHPCSHTHMNVRQQGCWHVHGRQYDNTRNYQDFTTG